MWTAATIGGHWRVPPLFDARHYFAHRIILVCVGRAEFKLDHVDRLTVRSCIVLALWLDVEVAVAQMAGGRAGCVVRFCSELRQLQRRREFNGNGESDPGFFAQSFDDPERAA